MTLLLSSTLERPRPRISFSFKQEIRVEVLGFSGVRVSEIGSRRHFPPFTRPGTVPVPVPAHDANLVLSMTELPIAVGSIEMLVSPRKLLFLNKLSKWM